MIQIIINKDKNNKKIVAIAKNLLNSHRKLMIELRKIEDKNSYISYLKLIRNICETSNYVRNISNEGAHRTFEAILDVIREALNENP